MKLLQTMPVLVAISFLSDGLDDIASLRANNVRFVPTQRDASANDHQQHEGFNTILEKTARNSSGPRSGSYLHVESLDAKEKSHNGILVPKLVPSCFISMWLQIRPMEVDVSNELEKPFACFVY